MTLKEYLAKTEMTVTAFASEVGIPQATIHRYVHGSRFPKREMILRIERATLGKVTPADWFSSMKETAA